MTQKSLPVLGGIGQGPTGFLCRGTKHHVILILSKAKGKDPRISLLLLLVLAFASAKPAPAQGCAQCRETLGQTPIRTQTAYRRAITTLVLAGTTIFTASFLALKRFR